MNKKALTRVESIALVMEQFNKHNPKATEDQISEMFDKIDDSSDRIIKTYLALYDKIDE